MKKRIIALIACVLVSGTAGAFAKSVDTNAVPAGADTVTSTAEALANNPVSTNPVVTAVPKTADTTATCNNGVQAALKSVASKTTSNTASSCPRNTAAQQAVKAAVNNSSNCNNTNNSANTANSLQDISQYLKVLSCNQNGNYVNGIACLKGSNCTTGNCVSLINCLYGVNCKTGNCSTSNCKNNSTANTSSSSNNSTANSSSSNSTTGSNTSSAPVSSAPQGNTSSTPSSTSGSYSSFQNQVVQLVNKERAANGLKALTVNSQLTKTATLKSEDMVKLNYFDHTSPTYGSPFDMMKQFGITYRAAGENIAKGQTTPEQVMQGWMNSPGHRANILNASFTQIGVGIAKTAQGQYVWTQQFIG